MILFKITPAFCVSSQAVLMLAFFFFPLCCAFTPHSYLLVCFEYVIFCLLNTRLPCRWYMLWNYSWNLSAFQQLDKSADHKSDIVRKNMRFEFEAALQHLVSLLSSTIRHTSNYNMHRVSTYMPFLDSVNLCYHAGKTSLPHLLTTTGSENI